MNVVNMPGKIVLIADRVLPVTSLPKRKFAIRMAAYYDPRNEQSGAEISLDPPPTAGKVRITRRQGHDRMKMIREDHCRVDRERVFSPRRAECRAKHADLIYQRHRPAVP
jgi:hypothetical protein